MINNPIISQNKSYFDPVWLQIRCFLSKLLRYRWNVTGKTVLIWIISTRRKNRTLSQQESSLWKYTTFDPNWQIKTVTSFGLRLVLKHAISVYQFFWRTAVDKTYFSKLLNRGSPLLFVVFCIFFSRAHCISIYITRPHWTTCIYMSVASAFLPYDMSLWIMELFTV